MDQGLAVILGALIALTGSSFVPWIRETLAARRLETQRRRERILQAVVDLIAANAAVGATMTLDDNPRFLQAFENRGRAAAILLLEVSSSTERAGLSEAIRVAGPARIDTAVRHRAFQNMLLAWAAGDVDASDALALFHSDFDRMKGEKSS